MCVCVGVFCVFLRVAVLFIHHYPLIMEPPGPPANSSCPASPHFKHLRHICHQCLSPSPGTGRTLELVEEARLLPPLCREEELPVLCTLQPRIAPPQPPEYYLGEPTERFYIGDHLDAAALSSDDSPTSGEEGSNLEVPAPLRTRNQQCPE